MKPDKSEEIDWWTLPGVVEPSDEEKAELERAEENCQSCERGSNPCIIWVMRHKCTDPLMKA